MHGYHPIYSSLRPHNPQIHQALQPYTSCWGRTSSCKAFTLPAILSLRSRSTTLWGSVTCPRQARILGRVAGRCSAAIIQTRVGWPWKAWWIWGTTSRNERDCACPNAENEPSKCIDSLSLLPEKILASTSPWKPLVTSQRHLCRCNPALQAQA